MVLTYMVSYGVSPISFIHSDHDKRVVQEAAVSSRTTTLMCGPDTVVWHSTRDAVRAFARGLKYFTISSLWSRSSMKQRGKRYSSGVSYISPNFQPLIDVLDLQFQQIGRREGVGPASVEPDFLDLAYLVRNKRSTIIADQLYGIMGLASIRRGEFFKPDYSLSSDEVYEQFRKALLASTEAESQEAYNESAHSVNNSRSPRSDADNDSKGAISRKQRTGFSFFKSKIGKAKSNGVIEDTEASRGRTTAPS